MEARRIETIGGYYRRRAPLVFLGHRHPDREFKYLLSGKLEVTYGNAVITLTAGDVMLTEPNVFHRERTLSEDCEYIVLQFSPTEPTLGEAARIGHPRGTDAALCRLLCERLAAEFPSNAIKREALPLSPASLCLFEAVLHITEAAPREHAPESRREEIYRRAIDLMQAELSRHLTIGELSRAIGVSPTLLKSVFSEYTGQGVQAHYLGLRMEAARRLLLEGIPAAEVSVRLGFSSPSYFSQCFLREHGCPPSRYRKGSI